MNVLAFDTALEACSAAVWSDGTVLAAESLGLARGHAELLFPMLGRVLSQAGMDYGDIDRFGVTVGPGSFTGVRVGVAAARGLALSLAKPAVGVTTLEAIAAGALASHPEPASAEAALAVALDARRGEIYLQIFTTGQARPSSPPMVVGLEEAVRQVPPGPIVAVGSGAGLLREALGPARAVRVLDRPVLPDAGILAGLVAGRGLAPDAPPPSPLYLRAPDAKLPEAPPRAGLAPAADRDRRGH